MDFWREQGQTEQCGAEQEPSCSLWGKELLMDPCACEGGTSAGTCQHHSWCPCTSEMAHAGAHLHPGALLALLISLGVLPGISVHL